MRRIALSLFVLFSCVGYSQQVDITGASLEWDYLGNSQFKFRLYLLTPDCFNSGSLNSIPGVSDTIPFTLQNNYYLDSACNSTTPCFVNDSASGYRTMVYFYETSTITLPSPATGGFEEYTWTMQNVRDATNIGGTGALDEDLVLTVRMYDNGFPRSSPRVLFGGGSSVGVNQSVNLEMRSYSTYGDSLYYSLIPALGTIQNPGITYATGYSYQNPVDNLVSFDPQTGSIHSSGLFPNYSYVVKQELNSFFKGGISTSIQVEREYLSDTMVTSQPVPPQMISLTSSDPNMVVNSDSTYIRARTSAGNTLTLQVAFTDGNLSDSMQFSTLSVASNGPIPVITPGTGSTNPSTPLYMAIDVNWTPSASTIAGPHRTVIQVRDFGCPSAVRYLVLDLFTDEPLVAIDTIQGCLGDEGNAGIVLPPGDYSWHPRFDLDDPLSANPTFTFNDERLYELYQGAVLIRSVFVDTISLPTPVIHAPGGELKVADSSSYQSASWYLYDIGIPSPYFSLGSSVGGGIYQVDARFENCIETSAKFAHSLSPYTRTVMHRLTKSDSLQTLATGESIEIDIRRNAPTNVWLRELLIPNLGLAAGAELLLTVSNSGGVVYVDTAERRDAYSYVIDLPDPGLGYDFSWQNQSTYTFTFEALGGDIQFPVTNSLSGGQTFDFYVVDNLTSPASFPNQMIAFIMFTSNDVSIEESDKTGIVIYPNPTSDRIHVQLDSPLQEQWTLYSATSQILGSGVCKEYFELDVSGYPSGIYFLHVGSNVRRVIKK